MRSICLLIAAVVSLPLLGGCTYYEHDHYHRYRDRVVYSDDYRPHYHHHYHDRCD
jgi:hypothetical protein